MKIYPIKFIDREIELNQLLKYCKFGFYPILYIYGPEGCGKTRLLKELINKVKEVEHDYLIIYIDTTCTSNIQDALITIPDITKEFLELIKETGPIGRLIALSITYILKKIEKYLIKDKHIVLLIDDVAKPLGLDIIEFYAKKLLDLIEELYSKEARSVFILATTSEGISRKLLARHNYVFLTQIWNLDKNSSTY